jgi:hypothetical protein
MHLTTRCLLVSLVAATILALHVAGARAQPASRAASVPQPVARRDGQHDLDFSLGRWRTHISRRVHPLTGSDEWAHYDGSSIIRAIWGGRASLGETEADGPAGHLQALSLRLYNPQSHQWSLSYASTGGTTSNPTSLSVPTIGEFKDGRGEFYDTESYSGRSILVRKTWSDITAKSIRFEQAFSEDGGRTWETNWIALDTRLETSESPDAQSPAAIDSSLPAPGHQHDFDFEFGVWKTHLKRLVHPLTGSKTWVEYDGTTTVNKVWNGRANLVELEVDGPKGHIEALSLRLYNPQSRQWSLNFANSAEGTVAIPSIGEFKGGRGEFIDQEPFGARTILVRFVITQKSPNVCEFEQSYSDDGGKTWEVNWIAGDSLMRDEPDNVGAAMERGQLP